jgi:hypothetical protein
MDRIDKLDNLEGCILFKPAEPQRPEVRRQRAEPPNSELLTTPEADKAQNS